MRALLSPRILSDMRAPAPLCRPLTLTEHLTVRATTIDPAPWLARGFVG